MELLLLSNSSLPGKAWLEHAPPLIAGQLNGRRSAVFIPFAGVTQTWDDYTAKAAGCSPRLAFPSPVFTASPTRWRRLPPLKW